MVKMRSESHRKRDLHAYEAISDRALVARCESGYPIDPLIDTGPPFFVCPEHYDVLLGADFSKVYDKIPMMSTEMHVGKDWMVV
ncbi:hypothetical protein BD779DRAFT_1809387 [Infundibulicybe gibba]|nr:hypothetical protein BD779DRAFT_1809387 [Infundibulicybe gibba]